MVKGMGVKRTRKGEKRQNVVFIPCLGPPEGLERHRDALGVWVLELITARAVSQQEAAQDTARGHVPPKQPPTIFSKPRLLHPWS